MPDENLSFAGRLSARIAPRLEPLHNVMTRVHRWVYKKSGGRIAAEMGGAPMLLLTTTGRKSGEPREIPLLTFSDGDTWIVIGSNFGKDHDPAWIRNLEADPAATVQRGRESFAVRAAFVEGDEHARLWARAVEVNSGFQNYADGTDRNIRIVRLNPA